jgi:predicted nuclease of predicted toxin-antitoxin system
VPAPRLLLDEDVPLDLAEALRSRGFDVVHASEVGLRHTADAQVLARAVELGRAMLIHNVGDYMRLVEEYGRTGRAHLGVIVAEQIPFKMLLARAARLLAEREEQSLRDAVVWLVG